MLRGARRGPGGAAWRGGLEGRPGGAEGSRAPRGAGTSLDTGGRPTPCARPPPSLAVPARMSPPHGAPRGTPLGPLPPRAPGTASCPRPPGPGGRGPAPHAHMPMALWPQPLPLPGLPPPPRAPRFLFSFFLLFFFTVAQGGRSAWGVALRVLCLFVCWF